MLFHEHSLDVVIVSITTETVHHASIEGLADGSWVG